MTLLTDYGLDALAADIHQNSINKGFWEGEIDMDKFAAKLALVHSEATEVLEALRKEKGSHEVTKEISDILVRTLDLYAALRDAGETTHSLDEVFEEITTNNKNRPAKHGHRWG